MAPFAARPVLAGLGLLPALAAAQVFPSKPVKLVVGSPPGGIDAYVRLFGPRAAEQLGQPVVIENLPGAGGITGTTQLVRAPKDGSVIGVVSNNHVVNPHVYKSAPFDAIEDITPLTVIGATPFVLVAHPSVQARNVKELIALAKVRPDQKIVLIRDWADTEARLKGTAAIMIMLARLAAAGEKKAA